MQSRHFRRYPRHRRLNIAKTSPASFPQARVTSSYGQSSLSASLSSCARISSASFSALEHLPGTRRVSRRVEDVHGTGILLLALASTLGQIFLAVLSLVALRGIAPGLTRMLARPFIDGCIAALAGGTAAYATLALEGGIAPLTTLMSVFTQGLVAGIIGLGASALALFIVENEEFRIVTNALTRLVRLPVERSDVLAPSAEDPVQP